MMRKPVQSLHGSATNPKRRALPERVREGVTNRGQGAHVEVTPDEVNVVLYHVSIKTLQERGGNVAHLGHLVVNVDGTERDRGRA